MGYIGGVIHESEQEKTADNVNGRYNLSDTTFLYIQYKPV